MKRFLSLSLISLSVLVVACSNMTLFNKVQVKAAPSIYAPLGGKKIEVKEYLTTEEISDLFGKDSKFKVYNYAGGTGDVMTFLMYYPVIDMPLNFDEYLGKLDMSQLNTSIPKVEFSIPNFDTSLESQTVVVPGTEVFAGTSLTGDALSSVNNLITSNSPLQITEEKFNVVSTGLVSAVLKEGNKITLKLTPTISGISVSSANISLSLPGSGETVSFVEEGGHYVASLGNKKIAPGEFSITGSITISANLAAGTVIPSSGIGVKIDTSLDLNHGFSSATIEVPEGTKLSQTVETPLPEEMTKLVSSITFNSIGAVVTLNNGLPPNNSIEVTVDSTELKINSQKESFASKDNLASGEITEPKKFTGANNLTLNPNVTEKIDIKMQVELPGQSSDGTTFTINNVKPGETYSIDGSVAFDVDWETAKVKTDTPYEGVFPTDKDKPIDLSKIWDKMPKGISLKDVGAYLYIDAPMENFEMYGSVKINETEILGEKDELKKASAPTPPTEGDWTSPLDTTKVSHNFGSDLRDIMNGRPESLSFNYSLNADEVEFTKDQIQGEQSVSAVMILTLPFDLNVDSTQVTETLPFPENPFGKTGVFVDIFKLANVYSSEPDANNDLFKRDEPWPENGEINKLLGEITGIKLEVKYDNKLGMEMGGLLYDSKTGISEFFKIQPGEGVAEVNLNATDVNSVLKTYPFEPRVYVFIPDTTESQSFALKKDGNIDFSLTVAAVTDIDYTYDLKGGN